MGTGKVVLVKRFGHWKIKAVFTMVVRTSCFKISQQCSSTTALMICNLWSGLESFLNFGDCQLGHMSLGPDVRSPPETLWSA